MRLFDRVYEWATRPRNAYECPACARKFGWTPAWDDQSWQSTGTQPTYCTPKCRDDYKRAMTLPPVSEQVFDQDQDRTDLARLEAIWEAS